MVATPVGRRTRCGSFRGKAASPTTRTTVKPFRVRFVWTPCSELGQPRWGQAFSTDRGASWEINWVMDFSPHRSACSRATMPVVELRSYRLVPGSREQFPSWSANAACPDAGLGMDVLDCNPSLHDADQLLS